MPVIDRLPVPEPRRQITPGAARPGPEEDPVDHLAVIGPPATARRISGQQPTQAVPLLTGQIMAIQQIKHRTDLHDPAVKIHGTRPRADQRIRFDDIAAVVFYLKAVSWSIPGYSLEKYRDRLRALYEDASVWPVVTSGHRFLLVASKPG